MPGVLLVITCGAAVTVAVTGAAQPLGGLQFLPVGHWVYNVAVRSAFHIDGATSSVDAQAPVPGDPGSQVVQGDSSGYVVGKDRITEFGKSSLTVAGSVAPPAGEVPVGVETAGGPYLVYREAVRVVRPGDPPASLSAGGPVGDPVATAGGTLWLYRAGSGLLCDLQKGAEQLSGCPVTVPAGHTGALTLVADQPWFVDTTTGALRPVGAAGLGDPVPLGTAVSAQSQPAANDVSGRVAILDQPGRRLYLVDAAHPGKPVVVPLPDGDYSDPVSTGQVVALVDRKSGTLLTYDATGRLVASKPIPPESGTPRLSRGEDARVYVDGGQGEHVLVVDHDGKIVDVPVGGDHSGDAPKPTTPPDGSVVPPAEHRPGDAPTGKPQPGSTGTPRKPTPPPEHKPDPPKPPTAPASPPGAPSSVSATAGNGSATVSWGAAADNRAPITSYRVSWSGGSLTVGGGTRSANISGLSNGVRYTFTVAAVNKAGTGPGASAPAVTPAAAASAPPGFTVKNQNGGAALSWGTPELNGGTLQHYLVSGSGLGDKTVTGTSTTFTGLSPGDSVTFTVRAVTRTPDGQTRTGAAASKTLTVPSPSITISQGKSTTSGSCKAPDCAQVDVSMKGFAPNTRYTITLHSDDNNDVAHESTTTNASGSATYNELDYDVPGEHVWVAVTTPDGTVTSNKITWE